jgi:hypothetical protein
VLQGHRKALWQSPALGLRVPDAPGPAGCYSAVPCSFAEAATAYITHDSTSPPGVGPPAASRSCECACGSANRLLPFPDHPKHMQYRTYLRLMALDRRLMGASTAALAAS